MTNTISKKERAYEAIKQAIIAGTLETGIIYSIAEISERFELGRTPAREALVILAAEGLIEPIPRSGYQVKTLSIQDLLEIFHLRSVLEVEGVGLAAERITEDVINYLEENNRLETALEHNSNDPDSYFQRGYELNLDFHLTIAKASGNNRLVDLLIKLLTELERVLTHDPQIAEPQQHAEILKALRQRDKAGAQEAMRKHLEETKKQSLSRF